MRTKGTREYPSNWKEIATEIKEKAGWKCVRCGEPNSRKRGCILTVHHLDGDKSNCEEWNLAALCQRCHLSIQGRVFLPQFYMFEYSKWFVPYVEGYYKAMAKKTEEVFNERRKQRAATNAD